MKKHIIISGKVQGVGFRYWLHKKANKKNIYGWVKNTVSGEVEALFIGDETKISDLIELFWEIIRQHACNTKVLKKF